MAKKGKKLLEKITETTLILLIVLFFYSCGPKKVEPPFIIVNKCKITNKLVEYTYQDKNGVRVKFTDINRYEIGDTL
jgi:hypothetical protein